MDFSFIRSNRFWCLVAVAVLNVLQGMGLIGPELVETLNKLLLGFVVVRTIDRNTGDTIGKRLFGKK